MRFTVRQAALLLLLSLATALPAQEKGKGGKGKGEKFQPTPGQKTVLELTNEARKKEGLSALTLSPLLTQVADAHSKNQATQGKMDHVLDGKTPVDRVKAAGYKYRSMAENVAYGVNQTHEAIFQGWMESPGHRKNILNKDLTEIGIGIAKNDKGEVYYTQVFGTPRP